MTALTEATEAGGGAVLDTTDARALTGALATRARWESEAPLGSTGSEETAATTSTAPTETPSSVPRTLSPDPAPEATPFAGVFAGPASIGFPAIVA